MREQLRLLRKLRLRIILFGVTGGGMCTTVSHMYCNDLITYRERKILNNFLRRNTPDHIFILCYWWNPGRRLPRIKWLNRRIHILKNLIKYDRHFN